MAANLSAQAIVSSVCNLVIARSPFGSTTTHLICKRPTRSGIFVGACAKGIWILKRSFIDDSEKVGRWLDESQFEWSSNDAKHYPFVEKNLFHAPKFWREARSRNYLPFEKCTVVIFCNDEQKLRGYQSVLDIGGARVMTREEFEEKPRTANFLFFEPNCKQFVAKYEKIVPQIHQTDSIADIIINQACNESATLMTRPAFFSEGIDLPRPSTGKKRRLVTDSRNRKRTDMIESCGFDYSRRLVRPSSLRIPVNRQQDQICRNRLFLIHTEEQVHNRQRQNYNPMPVDEVTLFENHLYHKHYHSAIQIIKNCMIQFYPTSVVLRALVQSFIMVNEDDALQNEGFSLLMECLRRYPPTSAELKREYKLSLCPSIHCSKKYTPDSISTEMWRFIIECIDKFLTGNENNSHVIILRFIVKLLWTDYKAFFNSSIINTKEKSKQPIMFSLLWPYHYQTPCACDKHTELLNAFLSLYERNPNFSSEAVSMVYSIYLLSIDCCYVADQYPKSFHQSDWQPFLGEQGLSLAIKLAGRTDQMKCSHSKLNLINNIPLDWLTACVCEFILLTFDGSNAIVKTSGKLTNESLSLQKVLNCYFQLVPYGRKIKSNDFQKVQFKIPQRQNGIFHILTYSCMMPGSADKLILYYSSSIARCKRVKGNLEKRNAKGETKLHLACKRNEVNKIKKLIVSGTDVNALDNCDWTPLHEACNRGNTEAAKAMIKLSQKLNKNHNMVASGDGGVTPMHDAILNDHYEAAVVLLEYGGPLFLTHQGSCDVTPLELVDEEKKKKRLTSIANDVGYKSYIVQVESCELYLTSLTCLIDILITQMIVQEPTINSGNDDEICIVGVINEARTQAPSVRSPGNTLRTVFNKLSDLESHVLAIIDGKKLTNVCKQNLARMKLDVWHAMRILRNN
ncbi:uncharacterized protein TRIADDRAFT_51497 [Trichoplax adhaerens]|uniref:SMC5-SMC6 complex localization factor protein 1 n=1 Tax=Trichoplax adhaerens TaxID=10228 RepID=B3RJD3_TRIAD|nr:predicted protein [Trichoplax adhaerens]EDV29313.1 predicted protein [Trichoplax adhaerens]|eukprot:XP_002108515.1 predicted protein [Trichoplax adhaerens]